MAGNGSTLFYGGLFWRWFRFGGNWLHIIFRRIVLEAAQIWRELAPHYFLTDCFGGRSDLAGNGSLLFFGGLFWKWLRFGGNWLHIIFRWIALEAAQIWRELAPHYFTADCLGGCFEYDSVQIFQTTTYSNKSNIEEKYVILLANFFFTTMVMAASSNDNGSTRQRQ